VWAIEHIGSGGGEGDMKSLLVQQIQQARRKRSQRSEIRNNREDSPQHVFIRLLGQTKEI
jgi:hypothetical protein